jgi:hypothetical protein
MADETPQQQQQRNMYAQALSNAWHWANQQMQDPQTADLIRQGVQMSEGGVAPPSGAAAGAVSRYLAPLLGRGVSTAARYGLNSMLPNAQAAPPSGYGW